eukprot:s756_g10.t1
MTMIRKLYARHYDIQQLFVSPADQGHSGVARDRTYLVLTLKDKVTQVFDVQAVYRLVSNYIRQKVQTRPSDYLIATTDDLLMDAWNISNKRKKRFPDFKKVKKTWYGKRFSMKRLLNRREAKGVQFALKKYESTIGPHPKSDDELVVFLGDTPQKRLCWSARSRRLPTYRRNNGFMWHVKSESWFTYKEKLASLGFPVNEAMARSMGVPVIASKDLLRASSIVGNSFHFSTAACVQLIALCCFKFQGS